MLTQCDIADYYFQKVENYLARKHHNAFKNSSNPFSIDSQDEEEKVAEEVLEGTAASSSTVFSAISQEKIACHGPGAPGDSMREMESLHTAGTGNQGSGSPSGADISAFSSSNKGNQTHMQLKQNDEEDYSLFRDFSEPDVQKTGFLIPLRCGHNGAIS